MGPLCFFDNDKNGTVKVCDMQGYVVHAKRNFWLSSLQKAENTRCSTYSTNQVRTCM